MSLSDVQTLSVSWQQEWFYIGILSDITSPGMTKESSTGGGVAGGKQTEANGKPGGKHVCRTVVANVQRGRKYEG